MASTELIVLVPVLDRPGNVAPLVDSFITSGTPGQLWFISGPTPLTNDEDAAIRETIKAQPERLQTWGVGIEIPDSGGMARQAVTWPEKINEMYRIARQEADWVLFAADDVTFHEGWWDATQPFRDQDEVMVIGTNDLGNPRVIAGDHTTHPLVRSSYLGTVDDPRAIVHTGYAHSYVDDEFIWTAKLRECWAFCPTAVVEHNHPFWAKSEWDTTYEKGQSTLEVDQALWLQRAPLLGLTVR